MKRMLAAAIYLLTAACVALGTVHWMDLSDRAQIGEHRALALTKRFITEYYRVRQGGELPDMSGYVADTQGTHLMLKLMEHDKDLAQLMDLSLERVHIHSISVKAHHQNLRSFSMVVQIDAQLCYEETEVESRLSSLYAVTLHRAMDGRIYIIQFMPMDDEFAPFREMSPEEIDEALEGLDLGRLRQQYDESVRADPEGEEEALPALVSVGYSGARAGQYGMVFGAHSGEGVFKRAPGNDCTGFVSQCLWAGYGGTEGLSLTADIGQLRLRALNDVRQVPRIWYGNSVLSRQSYPATRWMRVMELWSYMISNQEEGPRGEGFNDQRPWHEYTGTYRVGDVLQFRRHGYTAYQHSAVVSQIVGDTVFLSQHDADISARPLAEVLSLFALQGGGKPCDMRVIRPGGTVFAQ